MLPRVAPGLFAALTAPLRELRHFYEKWTKEAPNMCRGAMKRSGISPGRPISLELLQADRSNDWIGMMLRIVTDLGLTQVRRAIDKCYMSECLWIIP